MRYTHELRERTGHFVERKVIPMACAAFEIAQGFTVHGGQQHAAPFNRVLQKLVDKFPDLHVIYLTRRDAFAQAVSYIRALKTRRWGLYNFRHDKVKSQDIRPMDFRKDLNMMMHFARREFKARRKARRLLANQPSRTVIYEDLCENRVNAMWNTFRFLGVDWHPVEPETMKQAAAPLSRMVVAYDETRERFERRLNNEFGVKTLDTI
jgi:LPS sulfotransferase NodH